MFVRPASLDDLDALCDLGQRFVANSPYGALLDPQREDLHEGLANVLRSEHGCAWVIERQGAIVGALVGMLSTPWMSPLTRVAVELGWWVDPSHRGRHSIALLRAFEAWAGEHGARIVCLSDLVSLSGDTPAGALFAKLGYRVVERSHVKECV